MVTHTFNRNTQERQRQVDLWKFEAIFYTEINLSTPSLEKKSSSVKMYLSTKKTKHSLTS